MFICTKYITAHKKEKRQWSHARVLAPSRGGYLPAGARRTLNRTRDRESLALIFSRGQRQRTNDY